MKCGTSQVRITPRVGVELCGYAARVQPSVGVHDDLYVRGLYLEQGRERLLWLHADLIGYDGSWVRALRKDLAAELGLAAAADPRQRHAHAFRAGHGVDAAGNGGRR